MMRCGTIRDWQKLYGVKFSTRRDGLCLYTAFLEFQGRTLEIPRISIAFGPDVSQALWPLVDRARTAEVCGGSFRVWLDRQAPGRTMAEYQGEWLKYAGAYQALVEVFGDAAEDLIWSHK